MLDLQQQLVRQMVFSKATFGPGDRRKGVLDHIRKEIGEVEASSGDPDEWVDLVILALDGLTWSIWAGSGYAFSADDAAEDAVLRLAHKQAKNERREWPDWRTADPNKAIEHERGYHD